jgi:uncharacterized protein YegL
MQNPLFTNQTIQFETKLVDSNLVANSTIRDAKFGILNLAAISAPLNDRIQEFVFTVDCSGSMSDQCSDGRSKMQHILHTLKNMILYFKENSIKVFVTIYAFDHTIHKILERTNINNDNFNEIITKVHTIFPRGSTDIEKALVNSRDALLKLKSEYTEHNISHIFMTDGEVTTGNYNHDFLSAIVDRSITNAFIGFGIEHDSVLLNKLGSGENSTYYFIDKLENCGVVYGEVIYSILYKLIDNVTISIENGVIYDFKNNIWVSSLNVGPIVSESNKIYHILSSNPSECILTFSGINFSDLSDISFTITETESNKNLGKYIYRQRTLQYLFQVNDYLKRNNNNNISNNNISNFDNLFLFSQKIQDESMIKEESDLKNKLVSFISEMKQYILDNDLTNDGFMKNLCDDIYICYRTFGTKFGAMYVGARQTSQGTQRGYTVSHTPDDYVQNNIQLDRPINNHCDCFNCENLPSSIDDVMLGHELSDFSEAPYLTPTSIGLMREISCNDDYQEELQQEP